MQPCRDFPARSGPHVPTLQIYTADCEIRRKPRVFRTQQIGKAHSAATTAIVSTPPKAGVLTTIPLTAIFPPNPTRQHRSGQVPEPLSCPEHIARLPCRAAVSSIPFSRSAFPWNWERPVGEDQSKRPASARGQWP